MRIDQLRKEFDLEIRWSVFPLHPETPDEGQSLSELFAGRYDIEGMLQRCKRVADDLNLPFSHRTHTYNSRYAQELGKWAEEQGSGEAFHLAVYNAYFADGLNIARPEMLTGIVKSIGLDHEKAREVIDKRIYAEHVDKDWQRASEMGITAVPTCIYRQKTLVGFQTYENYRQFLTQD